MLLKHQNTLYTSWVLAYSWETRLILVTIKHQNTFYWNIRIHSISDEFWLTHERLDSPEWHDSCISVRIYILHESGRHFTSDQMSCHIGSGRRECWAVWRERVCMQWRLLCYLWLGWECVLVWSKWPLLATTYTALCDAMYTYFNMYIHICHIYIYIYIYDIHIQIHLYTHNTYIYVLSEVEMASFRNYVHGIMWCNAFMFKSVHTHMYLNIYNYICMHIYIYIFHQRSNWPLLATACTALCDAMHTYLHLCMYICTYT